MDRPTDRLLFVIRLPEPVAMQAAALPARFAIRGKPVLPDRLNLILYHLGDTVGLPRDMVAKAQRAAEAVKAEPFAVELDRVGSLAGRVRNLPFVLSGEAGADGVRNLARLLGEAMKGAGLGRHAKPLEPKITLAYDHTEHATAPVDPIRWTVSDFSLVHSLLGSAEHHELGRWTIKRD